MDAGAVRLVIKGRLPGLNEMISAERTNRYKAAKLKREAEELVIWSAKASLRGKIPTPTRMHYLWVEPNRKRDKDNVSGYGRKVIQDALVKAGYLPGDGWAYIDGFTDEFAVDAKYPRIEVTFERMSDNAGEDSGHGKGGMD